jgi:toxin ParE1/3/4
VIFWSKLAYKDINLIHEYISKDSHLYARKTIERIIIRVESLEAFPESGRVVPEFDNPVIRELIEDNYRIVYRYIPPQITILRIHHGARDLSRLKKGIRSK